MVVLIPLVTLAIPPFMLFLLHPDRMERVGPNAIIGMRTPLTMQSDHSWAVAHRAAWPFVKRSSAVLVWLLLAVAGWTIFETGESAEVVAALGTVGAVLVWLVILLAGLRAGHSGMGAPDEAQNEQP